jgi:hypothetical protein
MLSMTKLPGWFSILSISAALAAPHADAAAPALDAKTQAIVTACTSDVSTCEKAFERYSRTDVEKNIGGNASFFGWGKISDQTFFGYAQELYYTEVPLNGIEYQIGFGYIVTAHQQDAKPSGTGTVSGAQASGNADIGSTTFTTSLIGLAPDLSAKCATTAPAPPATVDQALLCAININPTVSQDYFKTAVNSLSVALAAWMKAPPTVASGKQPICPQVVNYKSTDPAMKGKRPLLDSQQEADFENIQRSIQAICVSKTSNSHVHYRNGPPLMVNSATLSVAGGTASASQSEISQGYFRNKYYWAITGGNANPMYDDSDRFSEVYINGLNASASFPSLFAAIITLNAAVQDQRVHVISQCSGGAKIISLDALDPPNAKSADPITQASGYSAFFEGLRDAADVPPATCR